MKTRTCCFIGHRSIFESEQLNETLRVLIEKLILKENVDTFLFGSKSKFNTLCLKIVTEIKEKYPYIKRVYVRAEYPHINESYKNYLLESFEDTYYPEKIISAGKGSYVERNYEMIDKSNFCIFYYNIYQSYVSRKSGTKIAIEYAKKQGKKIINVGNC